VLLDGTKGSEYRVTVLYIYYSFIPLELLFHLQDSLVTISYALIVTKDIFRYCYRIISVIGATSNKIIALKEIENSPVSMEILIKF
jgi:hypothetical protein